MDVLLDTHSWVWTLTDDQRLTAPARAAITAAATVRVSPISFFEIGQKVRIGKWPEMAPYLGTLTTALQEQGGVTAPFTPDVALDAATLDWSHRDPFDRIIAATAMLQDTVLVSGDTMFDTLPDPRLHRVW